MQGILYAAGTSFLLAAAQASTPSQSAAAIQKVRVCLSLLEDIGQTWSESNQQASVLRDLLAECEKANPGVTAMLGVERGWDAHKDES